MLHYKFRSVPIPLQDTNTTSSEDFTLVVLLVDIGESAETTVVSVKVLGHEDTWALRADLSKSLDVTISVDLVVLQGSELNLLMHVLNLLWLGVGLLLTLLTTTTKTEHQVQGRLLLNVVVGKSTSILELLTSEDQTLLIRWNSLLILDLGLHIFDCVRRLNLKGDGLASHFRKKKEKKKRTSVHRNVLINDSLRFTRVLQS